MKRKDPCKDCGDSECDAKEKRKDESEAEHRERRKLTSRMCKIKHKFVVLSGKGGVGKSTFAVNLATYLADQGNRVGLLDIDVHGPSIPKLLHIEGEPVIGDDLGMVPVVARGIKVMSIGFLLRGRNDPVVWRGPMKSNAIKEFLRDVSWGELDYLVVDCPPGTGDEPMTVLQLLTRPYGAIVVTTPQDLATQDVKRSIMFCRQINVPVLGVVENMSGFVCPKCGEHLEIFGAGGGKKMARELDAPFLGSIPFDTKIVKTADRGEPFLDSHPDASAAHAFRKIVASLLDIELPMTKKAAGKMGG